MCEENEDAITIRDDRHAYNLLDKLANDLRAALDDFINMAEDEAEAALYAEIIAAAASFSAEEWEPTPKVGEKE